MASSLDLSDPEISLEEDIVDQLCPVDIDDEIPARPSSRLGFNYLDYDDTPLTEEEFSEGVHFESLHVLHSRSRLGRLVEDEFDITTERDITVKTSRSGRSGDQWASFREFQAISDDEDPGLDQESEYSSCDEESDICSTDALVDTFSEPLDESDWSVSPKFSCLPSPLSSRYIPRHVSYRHTPQRHRYHQHGHSRHALLHLKWFWATREEMWIEHKARMCEAKAYDGLLIFSTVSPGLRLPGGYFPPDPADTPQPPPPPPTACLPPLSIHPRRGDLSALHDPYSMHIDRYFVGMPLWTMAKTLWMFDLHMASGDLANNEEELDSDLFEEAHIEDDSIKTSDSNAFSDDSDSTLVDSESEADVVRRVQAEQEAAGETSCELHASERGSDASSSSTPGPEESKSPASCQPEMPSPEPRCSRSPTPSVGWATNWYRRWEVLLQLCVEKDAKISGHDLPPMVSSSPPKPQRFFIGEDWNDLVNDDEDDEDEDEDEEDTALGNVLVVVNNDECSDDQYLHHWF
ncbi:hypothetical protein DXG01_014744 [Tephrocybe rancida]|nr:hypothetical protein DXG01_014744 [Tephrocybe rancida]